MLARGRGVGIESGTARQGTQHDQSDEAVALGKPSLAAIAVSDDGNPQQYVTR